MTYRPGEVVLALVPFTDGTGAKLRPALVLHDSGDEDLILARMTSAKPRGQYDVSLTDWKALKLSGPGIVRVDKPTAVAKSMVQKRLGSLSPVDHQQVAAILHGMYAAW